MISFTKRITTGGRYPSARVTDNRAQFALRWQDHQRATIGLPRQITNLNTPAHHER